MDCFLNDRCTIPLLEEKGLPSASALYTHMIEKHCCAYLADRKTERGNKGCSFPHIPLEVHFAPVTRFLGLAPQPMHSPPCTAHLAPHRLCGPAFMGEVHPSQPQEQAKPHGKPQGNAGADPLPGLPDTSHQPEALVQYCTATMHHLTLPACKLFEAYRL